MFIEKVFIAHYAQVKEQQLRQYETQIKDPNTKESKEYDDPRHHKDTIHSKSPTHMYTRRNRYSKVLWYFYVMF